MARKPIPASRDGEPSKIEAQLYTLTSGYGDYVDVPRGTKSITVELDDNTKDFFVEVNIGAGIFPVHKLPGSTWFLGIDGDILTNNAEDLNAVRIRLKEGVATGGIATITIKVAERTV